ncbi:MAG: cyanophycinase, partial [Verrucomicrobia bacterium]|nr:cyanophycinase [Cytophagales bacterium]
GDQANYANFWKNTPVSEAINYLMNEKKVPVGGTSAGCAILGEVIFDAINGTITTEEALQNPFDTKLSIQKGGFLQQAFLKNTITDTHYNNPDRKGRHLTFLARMSKDWELVAKGIGVEEKTAVCIDETGKAMVLGSNNAFFLQTTGQNPEICENNKPLTWHQAGEAVKVYVIKGGNPANGFVDLTDWSKISGGTWQYFSAKAGVFSVK